MKAGFGRTFSWRENEGSRAVFWPHGGEWRYYLHRISLEMAGDRPWLGWGGGCFVYLFPDYHGKVPELAATAYRSQPSLYRLIAVHGDGDWYEFLAEYGIMGCSLLLAAWVLLVVQVIRLGLGRRPELWPVAAGLAFAFLHGSIDLVLRNQAVIVLFAVLCVLLVRQCQFASADRSEAPATRDRPGVDSPRSISNERSGRASGKRGANGRGGRA
jgi:O-antigen ligase